MDPLRAAALAAIVAFDQGRLGPAEIDALRRLLAPPPPPRVEPPPRPPAPLPPSKPVCFLCGTSQGRLAPMGPHVWACFGGMCDVPY